MRSLVGFTRTGRIQKGPGSDLIEMTAPDGSRHTAIEFHPEYRSHNAINAALGVVLSFLESPLVSGLTDLGAYELGQSVFVYPTGQTWSVAEVVRTLSDLGEVGGVRAGVELMAQAGQILVEAAETGESAGVYSHGGLTPWRVMLDADGQVQIIGHALPQVEILTFHEQPDRIPREDAFRYCPPERMESRRENFSSDLFGLALIAFEVMCGKPVYDGLVNDIRAKAARGETSRRIHQFREFLPESARSLLTTTMRPDFRDRFGAGADFFDAVNAALSDPAVEGVGLRDMMQRVIRQQPRARQELDPGKTSMLSKDQLKKMMEEEEAPARPQRAAFAPARPAQPVAAPPMRAEPARPAERRPEPPQEPVRSVSMDALGASSSRVGLPPARRPPPRSEPTPEALPPAAAATPVVPPAAPPAPPAGEPPRFGPPIRQGARPNPRASHAGDLGASASAVAPAAQVASPPQPAPPQPPAPEPTSAEPPRPAVGVARLPPSRRPPPREDGGEVLPDAGRAVPPAPEVASSGDRARDLLARVRASGNDVTHRPTPSASAVIDRILTSSGSGSSLRDRVARAVQVDQAEPPVEPARVEPARVEPARVEPRQEPGLPPPVARPEPPAPPKHPRPDSEPTPAAPAAAPSAPPVAPPPVAAVAPAAPVTPPPVPAATPPVVAPATAPTAPSAPATPPPVAGPGAGPTKRYRVPDALKSNLRGDPLPYKLSRGNGSPVQRRRVPAASTLADIVGLLVGQVVPMRVTPDGRVAGWWRLGPAAGPLPPDTRLDTLDAEVPLVFHYVEARTLLLDVEVAGDAPVRLRLPVSTAVPAQSLIDALTTMFDLPAGEWVLTVDGAPLEPFHVLEDRGVGAASQLQLRRA